MLRKVGKSLLEWTRCVKHNLLDDVTFKISYRNGLYRVQTADGVKLRFRHNPYLAFVQIEGYLGRGMWTIEPGMCVLDAGACRGEFGLYAAARVGPQGCVFMMEPDASNRALIDDAIALNGGKPSNLVILDQGLWNKPTTLEFAAGLGVGSMLVDVGGNPGRMDRVARAQDVIVQVQSLTSLVDLYRMERMDFVKMDIEGAEVEAVEGAIAVMARFKPRFAIASYHRRDGKTAAKILEPLFAKVGYFAHTGFPQHPTTYASPTPLPVAPPRR